MHFFGSDGSPLELSVVGYEFPEERYDSKNWLVIAGRASLGGREWKFQSPCLQTYEAAALADCLEARSKDASNDGEIDFLEPSLRFTWSQGALQVDFDLECRPPWAPWDKVDEFYLRFSPSSDELASAASSLREDLLKYPMRPE